MAVSAVAFTAVRLPLATVSSTTSCDDVKFIFARGSGQTLDDEDYLVYQASIKAEMLRQKANLKIGFYELGSKPQNNAQYPAIGLDFFTILGSKISGGSAFAFGESVRQGIAELKNYSESVSASCPNTKIVVAGFSQGAMVITNGLSELNPERFIFAATFGDPKLYLPEGKGIIPDACLGKNLSPYRFFAPNCRTNTGSLDGKKPYVSNGWDGKVGLWCKDKDLVCGAGFQFGTPRNYNNFFEQIIQSALASHTNYAHDGIYYSAAKTIVDKIRETFPDAFLDEVAVSSDNRDTVILLDVTGSMEGYLEKYKTEALRLGAETYYAGGRVALYVYGDLSEMEPVRLVDFDDDLDYFTSELNSIGIMLDGGDIPESLYSAIGTILNNQNWRAGATKSIIVLTDAPALDPDRDGTTPDKVIAHSLEIDPVNIYVVTEDREAINAYKNFTSLTGGKVFSGIDTTSTDYLLSRPSVEFPLAEYYGHPNDEFTFTAKTSDSITNYEWDLDFDGSFETTSKVPAVSKIYPSDTSGYIQLKVTDSNGMSSTASAKVIIESSKPNPPSLNNLKVVQKGDSVHITFNLAENTVGALVSLDGISLGLVTGSELEITDVTQYSVLTLTPISFDGLFGTSLSGQINAQNSSTPLTPKTGLR